MRAYRLIAGLVGLFALVLQYGLILQAVPGRPAFATVNFFSYFTILSNVLVMLALLLPALAPSNAVARFFLRPGARTAIALYIAVTGLIYATVLQFLWAPQGWAFVADALLHYVMPLLYLLDWLLFAPRRSARRANLPIWLLFPAGYAVWSLARGAVAGWYPYPFLDVATLGYGAVLLNAAGLVALFAARDANMPKDTIERAIKRGAGGEDDANYEEVRYEGYGPGGVAVIVEALTDNRNRTASDVRSAFAKHGGALGETNSVSFMFERIGLIVYPLAAGSADAVFEQGLEAGASDVQTGEEAHEIVCAVEDLNAAREALEKSLGPAQSAKLVWRPVTTSAVDQAQAEQLFKLIDALDDNDDVQTVTANFEISDAVLARLTA